MNIENVIKKEMVDCVGYDKRYCDITMCMFECGMMEPAISFEVNKMYNLCNSCNGLGIRSVFSDYTSKTHNCNVCSGTGMYVLSIER